MTDFTGKTIRGEHDGKEAIVWFQNAALWRENNGALIARGLSRRDALALAADLTKLAMEMVPPPGPRWHGHVPTECQVSKKPITDEFVDGALKIGGHWAIMHPECHAYAGMGIGVGKGQRYSLIDGEWRKVEG